MARLIHNVRAHALYVEQEPAEKASNGRLTSQTNGFGEATGLLSNSVGQVSRRTLSSGQYEEYAYNSRGRVTTVTLKNSSGTVLWAQTNLYNALDTRVGSTTNSVARTFLRDGAYVTDPVLKDGAATYTPGVSERRGSATTCQHSVLKNADAQTGTAQTISATRQYDAFGNVASSTGTWTGPFGYAGGFGYQDELTGLKLLGHR